MEDKERKILLAVMTAIAVMLMYVAYEVQTGNYVFGKSKRDIAVMESRPVVPRAQETSVIWCRNR